MNGRRASSGPLVAVLALLGWPASLLWFVSPLALGFRQWPVDPWERWWIGTLYDATYFAGIPALLVTPLVAFGQDRGGFRRAARALPLVIFAVFFGLVAVVSHGWDNREPDRGGRTA